jgi:Glyoxalase-like domain
LVDRTFLPGLRAWPFAAMLMIGASPTSAQRPVEPLRVDHVIVGAADLDSGIAALREATGLTAQRGGVHPGRGTRNALLSLGAWSYLELVAPSGEPDSSGTTAWLASLTQLTPAGWAVAAPDLAATLHRLAEAGFAFTAPIRGSRRQPDGSVLRWTTAHPLGDRTGLAPFLIQWEPGVPHPAETSPAGCRLTSVELAAATPDPLRQLLAKMGAPATVSLAPASAIRLTLRCPTGEIILGR